MTIVRKFIVAPRPYKKKSECAEMEHMPNSDERFSGDPSSVSVCLNASIIEKKNELSRKHKFQRKTDKRCCSVCAAMRQVRFLTSDPSPPRTKNNTSTKKRESHKVGMVPNLVVFTSVPAQFHARYSGYGEVQFVCRVPHALRTSK